MKIKKSEYQSAIITSIIAGLILLLLIYCGLKAERNEMDEGVMVAFGDFEEGFGEQTPAPEEASSEASTPSTAVTPQPAEQQPTISDQKLMTQEDPSVALERERRRKAIEAENERKRQEAAAEKARKEAEEKRAKASSIAGNAFKKVGDGQGTGEGEGKAGNPVGHGSQGGNSWSLNGRTLQGRLAQPSYNGNEQGRIIVAIRVDANGKVIEATIATGTTITSEALRRSAVEAAKKNSFSKGNAPAVGTITYNFVLN
ncbi:MAG: energy transducer TonB [Paludibacteraceae bacterium]|nr:energy transducer TonB [Paludibacteraceae bacterium]